MNVKRIYYISTVYMTNALFVARNASCDTVDLQFYMPSIYIAMHLM